MRKASILKQIAVVLCCVATASFSSQPSGGSAGSLSAATATAAAVVTAVAHHADSKTLKDAVENPAVVRTQGNPKQFTFSPNGKFISVLTTSGAIQTFEIDSATGKFTPVQRNIFAGPNPRKVFYLSDDLLVTQHNDEVVTAENLLSGGLAKLTPDNNPLIRPVATCSAKKLVIIADTTSKLYLYRFDSKKQSFIPLVSSPATLEHGSASIELSPSGNIVAISRFVDEGEYKTSFYTLNDVTGALKHIAGSPIQTSPLAQIVFSPDDTWCVHAKNGESVIRVFALDPIQGITEQTSCPSHYWLTSIAVSPDSRFVADTNAGLKREITVHAVDSATKTIQSIEGSQVKTRFFPACITYSPSGELAVVANQADQSISIYEVDRETGKFTPLTGELLQSEVARRAMPLAREVLVDHGPFVHGIIARYLGAIYDTAPSASVAIEEIIEADLAIARTEEESNPKKVQETRVSLFEAISKARFDAIAPLLTPFTVNARDEESRTALMHAVRHSDTDSIVEQLLKYQGEKQYSLHSKEAVEVDLNAVDYDGDTALIYAIKNNRFKAAGMLTQKMNKDVIAKANKKGETALSLAQEEKVRAKYAGDEYYEKLVSLLDDKKEAVEKIKEENKPEQVIEVVAK